MKKIFIILGLALIALIAVPVLASQPNCPEGSSYEGEYVEETVCENVCRSRIFGFCIRWEEVCSTSGYWVGSCVNNPVEPEEPNEEENGEEGEETNEEETPKPIIVKNFGGDLISILNNQCKEENIEYSEWSNCMPMFNMQIRTAKPLNGCRLTGEQQANLLKYCGAINLGISLK